LKRRIFFAILILLFLFSPLSSQISITNANNYSVSLDEGLVAYYKFDEGAGDIVYDSSGNGNDGRIVGAVWTLGKIGNALKFDGKDDYVVVSDSPSLRVQSFTLAAWIYITKRPYQHGTQHSAIINKLHYLSGCSKGYKLQFNHPTSTNDHLTVSLGDSVAQRFLIDYNSKEDLTLYQWHHIAATYDGSTTRLYIDGKLKCISNTGRYIIVHDETPLVIGSEYFATSIVKFNGVIDEVRIYNRALSNNEIKALAQSSYIIIDRTFVSDERADVESTQTVGFHAKWNNGSDANFGLISIKELRFSPINSGDIILFHDDFNEGVAEDWIEYLGRWSVVDGEYFVSVGIIENGISTVKGLDMADCIIETKLRFTDAVGYRAGIIFRYIDNEHYYSFEIGNEYDEIDIIKYSPRNPSYGETRTVIQPSYRNSSIVIKPNVDYTLKIQIQGNTFTAYLNGQKVLSWSDDSYPSGRVGLRARRADVYFDYFTVYSTDGFKEEVKIEEYLTNSTGWVFFNVTSSDVARYSWAVSSIDVNGVNNYLVQVEDPSIIWDRVNVTLAKNNRVEVGKEAHVAYQVIYEYDGESFFGTIILNDTLTKNVIGKYGYKVASIIDPRYDLKTFTTNEVFLIFDKINEKIDFETLFPGNIRVTVKLWYEYDDVSVEDATVKINGLEAKHLKNGIYEVVLNSWMPYLNINVDVERVGFKSISMNSIIYSLGNILSEVSAIILILIAGLKLNAKRTEEKKWLRNLDKLEEFVKERGRIELSEASIMLNVNTSEVKALLSELMNDKRIVGTFTSDGEGFVTEERLKEELIRRMKERED